MTTMTTLSAQNKEEKATQKRQAVKELVRSKNYKIYVNIALPMSGHSIQLSSEYYLEVKNDSLFSYLPYYGRAYMIPYDGGKGLIFNAPITSYQIKKNKKGKYEVTAETRNSEDTYKYYLTIFYDGSSNIQVNMQNRQSIGFIGRLDLKE